MLISLYLFCIFLFILWFYVSFGVLGLIWKNIEEMSLNRSKKGNIGKNLWSRRILDRPVVSGKSSAQGHWLLVPQRWLSRNWKLFPFSAQQRRGNLADSASDFFGYLRMSKTHLQAFKNTQTQKLKERIKRRRSLCSQVQIFYNLLPSFILLLSS